MKVVGVLLAVFGWLLPVVALNMTSSTGVRMFLCILGIGITLVAILSVLNKAHEKEAVFFAIDHFNELPVRGLAIRVFDKIGAISLYEPQTPDTALVHFEKGLPDCEGIYKAINTEVAARLAPHFTYINRESDLGVAGLREAKMRYHPHHMVEVYSLKRDS